MQIDIVVLKFLHKELEFIRITTILQLYPGKFPCKDTWI